MECDTVSELLPWWVNETLDGDERRLVAAHLGSCLVCRRELPRLRSLLEAARLRSLIEAAEEHVPSEDLVQHALGLPATDWSKRAIGDHLAGCSECRDLVETVRGVEENAPQRQTVAHAHPERRHYRVHLAAAAAAICVFGLGALQMLRGTDPLPLHRASVETAVEAPEIRHPGSTILFAESFESGDSNSWSLVVQGDGASSLDESVERAPARSLEGMQGLG